jgi:hypothetical protein
MAIGQTDLQATGSYQAATPVSTVFFRADIRVVAIPQAADTTGQRPSFKGVQ